MSYAIGVIRPDIEWVFIIMIRALALYTKDRVACMAEIIMSYNVLVAYTASYVPDYTVY